MNNAVLESLTYLGVSPERNAIFLQPLNDGMAKEEITTIICASHFLSQLLHETDMLIYMKEVGVNGKPAGVQYEGRRDLGNVYPGDGVKFPGRGGFDLTGRGAYTKYGLYSGQDTVNHPEILEQPHYAIDSAVWFFCVYKTDPADQSKPFIDDANNDNFLRVTYLINGGYNGIQNRLRLLNLCYMNLGLADADRIQRIEKVLSLCTENLTNQNRNQMERALFAHLPNEEAISDMRKVVFP